MEKDRLNDPDFVLFHGSPQLKPGEVELHRFGDKLFSRRLQDVKADWSKLSLQIKEMLNSFVSEAPEGLAMESLKVSLGFSGSGKLVFIAEAGIKASVTIEFKRK
jgi:hypothetical protein